MISVTRLGDLVQFGQLFKAWLFGIFGDFLQTLGDFLQTLCDSLLNPSGHPDNDLDKHLMRGVAF